VYFRLVRATAIVILCGISAFLVLIFSWLPKGGVYYFISHKFWGPGLLWCAGAKLEVSGLENVEGVERAIFISNHQSHFDIPSITTAVPIPFYFIAKKELKHIPIFGWGMWSIGMVFVDRNNREAAQKSMVKAARQVEKGKCILTFPEGTRSKDGKIQTFKKGAFHLAKKGPIQIIPIAVEGSKSVLPRGGKLSKGHIHVKVGKAIPQEEVDKHTINELVGIGKERVELLQEEIIKGLSIQQRD
jgi:1-acyl-sn-glycerol-3-phosphate acyltransferase